MTRLPESAVILPVQVLGELYRVLVGKLRQPAARAQEAVLQWSDTFAVRDSTWSALQSALDLSKAHGLSIWDSLILSVAAEQRCRVLAERRPASTGSPGAERRWSTRSSSRRIRCSMRSTMPGMR